MSYQDFEKLVRDGIFEIPEKFRKKMENVEIVIEDFPTKEQFKKTGLKKGDLIFGLYEGIPKTERGYHYVNILPDKITIFKKVIEQVANDPEQIKGIVKRTVWHEIAHHFGLDEKRVRELERKKFH